MCPRISACAARRVAPRIARACAHGRLHHQFGAVVAGEEVRECGLRIHARFDELAGNDRHAEARQVLQVVLVGIPAHHRWRVHQARDRGGASHPLEELADALGVVPRRAQQRHVEARPVDLRVIPHRHLRLRAGGREGGHQRRQVLIEITRTARAHQRDARAQSRIPVPRFMRATQVANSSAAAAVMSAKAPPTCTSDTPRKP